MKKIIDNLLSILLLISVLSISKTVHAQNLPRIQEASFRAPSDIKIDGKLTEWGDKFQAYNINNRIYYTLSNDNNNLYLTLRASDEYANEKALFGISFTANLSAEKDSEANLTVAFPTTISSQKSNLLRDNIRMARRLKNDTTKEALAKLDSIRLSLNTMMGDVFKEIEVIGIKDIPESVISIYNLEGIKVAVQFDETMQYSYELAIPLKYFGNYINDGQKFTYNIRTRGLLEKKPFGNEPPPPVLMGNPMENMSIDNRYVNYSTDFSGEYTILKE